MTMAETHGVEKVYTRDAKVPIVEGDDDFEYGWQCIPVQPTADDGWFIFDTSKDYKTGWCRIRREEAA
jgi:hypothetical protein